jgi:hypothetical protein
LKTTAAGNPVAGKRGKVAGGKEGEGEGHIVDNGGDVDAFAWVDVLRNWKQLGRQESDDDCEV